MSLFTTFSIAVVFGYLLLSACTMSLSNQRRVSRRTLFHESFAATASTATTFFNGSPANAAVDCFSDCLKNCKAIVPKDLNYCQENCKEYCADPDRTDGLSGSASASGGEVGILGGTFGTGTVVKGEDKPPSVKLPGLDFSTESGRKLIGY